MPSPGARSTPPRPPTPHPTRRRGELTRPDRRIGQIGQQPRPGVRHHPTPATAIVILGRVFPFPNGRVGCLLLEA